jgi:hypothetical protein
LAAVFAVVSLIGCFLFCLLHKPGKGLTNTSQDLCDIESALS